MWIAQTDKTVPLNSRCAVLLLFAGLLLSACRTGGDIDPTEPPVVPTAEATDDLTIDLNARTIGGVGVSMSEDELTQRFGDTNVRTEVRSLEGVPDTIRVVTISEHDVRQHARFIATDDPAFQTREGLGVGSTIGELERALGQPALEEGEGGDYVSFMGEDQTELTVLIPAQCISWTENESSTYEIDSDCRPVELLIFN